ncbi:MAG: leucine-rich repeat protein [Eggerthellaceae bacterium]|nr:leucine-rich repeat protein [Eggerthellaceae bacterium]
MSADMALGPDESAPLAVGSFTVDGLSFQVRADGSAELVAVNSPADAYLAPAPFKMPGGSPVVTLEVPAAVTYYDVEYPVTALGAHAFYLSGVLRVVLPVSIASVDERAFRSSDVAWVDVDPLNLAYSSHDGVLYDADLVSLLLIPGGRGGAVRVPDTATSVPASAFSHCAGVSAIAVDEGSPAFSSWEGLLYDADGTTLLRVPAGATEVTIREGCTSIAAGALEACAKLERINAPASVTSISPDVLASIPTVSLPVASALDGSQLATEDDVLEDAHIAQTLASGPADGSSRADGSETASNPEAFDAGQAPSETASPQSSRTSPSEASSPANAQLASLVALSSTEADATPQVDAAFISVWLPEGAVKALWETAGFAVSKETAAVAPGSDSQEEGPTAAIEGSMAYAAQYNLTSYANGTMYIGSWTSSASPSGSINSTRSAGSGYYFPDKWIAFSASNACVTHWNDELQPAQPYWYTGIGSVTGGVKYATLNGASFSGSTYLSGAATLWMYNETSPVTITWNASWTGGTVSPASSRPALGSTLNAPLPTKTGHDFTGWYTASTGGSKVCGSASSGGTTPAIRNSATYYARFTPHTYTVTLDAKGGTGAGGPVKATYGSALAKVAIPLKAGEVFAGYYTEADGAGTRIYDEQGNPAVSTWSIAKDTTLHAQWTAIDFDLDSEPKDEDYVGSWKGESPDVTLEEGTGDQVIANPQRPGYVFIGWVSDNDPNDKGLVSSVGEGDDKKWVIDSDKLLDYTGEDGRVHLTARWTSVISVDVPSSVTFYADAVTQGNESREGLASSAFGQSKVASQSEVDLRIVGLESKQVKGNGSTSLGASDILKKKDGGTVSGTADKLFSLYPATGELKEDDLKDPDRTSAKPADAVDFSLDDILLEKSFAADEFTIPAGDTLSLGYRLNLQETGTELDYDKLSTLSEGASAFIANISYCFAADALPSDWGEPLWIENPDQSTNPAKYLLLKDIKAAADDLSANGTSSTYYSMYKSMLDSQVTNNGNAGRGPYFQLKVGNAYIDLQLIGICQDTKSAGGKAGLTFQTRDIYAYGSIKSIAAGGGAFSTYMNFTNTNVGGWASSAMHSTLISTFWSTLPVETQAAIVGVDKHQQLPSGTTASYLQKTTGETVWLPSVREVFGAAFADYNESEALTTVAGYVPFQYMAYQPGGTSTPNTRAIKTYNGSACIWWLRSACRYNTNLFCLVHSNGDRNNITANSTIGAAPCFCL